MTAIPTKLYEAFEKIRLGKAEEGTRLFDRVDGFEDVKAIPLAELSYFRHDWKHGIQFSFDFLASETDWETVRYSMRGYKEIHLRVILLGTCLLDSWKANQSHLQQLRKNYDSSTGPKAYTGSYNNYNLYQHTISLMSDPVNTKRHLLESRPSVKKEGKKELKHFEIWAQNAVSESRPRKSHWTRSFDRLMRQARLEASTEDFLAFYRQYTDRLKAESHQEAAKSYIALDNLLEAKEAIRQYMRCWKFKEPFQVAPIELFADPELWTIMSDQRFTESLLAIPHHRES